MRQIDDYIPIELWHESKNFLEEINCDIEIYEKFKTFEKNLNEDAQKFEAWWNFKRYADYPHSLSLLYDNITKIDIEIGGYDMLDGFRKLETKLVMLYRLLKENGMIND
ncbi:MAG: hypothetical protein MST05_07515 [Treponema sp.]|nr:hypothetical protein [Treponema sp.]